MQNFSSNKQRHVTVLLPKWDCTRQFVNFLPQFRKKFTAESELLAWSSLNNASEKKTRLTLLGHAAIFKYPIATRHAFLLSIYIRFYLFYDAL